MQRSQLINKTDRGKIDPKWTQIDSFGKARKAGPLSNQITNKLASIGRQLSQLLLLNHAVLGGSGDPHFRPKVPKSRELKNGQLNNLRIEELDNLRIEDLKN